MMKKIAISVIAALLIVGVAALCRQAPRTVDYAECSEVYRHYADMQLDGVRVTYIRDKRINDTLRLPVTVIEALDDTGWQQIDSLFGYSKNVEEICAMPDLPDSVKAELVNTLHSFYTYRAHRESPSVVGRSADVRPDDLAVYIFLNLRCVLIYEPNDIRTEYDILNSRAITNQQEIEIRN